ncbi:hypothetical protein BDV06DRAFT_235231 [Aspergillus oleicola]
MSFATAASIPLSFAIAYHTLVGLARLQEGESVLIHSGAGGVGQAAIQIARARGADIYTTVCSGEKQRLLARLYGIPFNRIIVGRGASFKRQLDCVTDGVDVVLSSLSGDSLRRSLACLRPFGRLIDISTADRKSPETLPNLLLMTKNITYSSFDLSLALERSSSLVEALMASVEQMLVTSQIRAPGPISRFPASSVEDAFQCVQGGKIGGKVVVEMNEGELLSVVPSTAPSCRFYGDASYVIVGGFGGLGKSTTRWMIDRGAKYLILLMDDFHTAVRPNFAGSWNLHRALPRDLDFFIMLASAGGILGTRGQSNYASGNTYQDALARYRVSRGQKAISLDLGLVVGVGFAAENRESLQQLHKLGYRGIREKEYLAMLGYLCDSNLAIPQDPSKSQLITGLEIPEYLRSSTVDSREQQSAREWMRWVPRPLFRYLALLVGYNMSRSKDAPVIAHQADLAFQKKFIAALDGASPSTVAGVVASALKDKMASILRISKEDIETEKPVHTYGIDSLFAVELRYWISKEFRSDLSVFEIMGE